MAQLTDYAENKIVDAVLRGQALGAPATWYVGLLTAAPSDASAGTETSYTNYARQPIAASLAAWAGTQGATTTVASSGTGGQTSNNAAVAFPAPGSGPVTVTHFALYDAVTAGNMWIYGTLTVSRVLNNGDAAPTFAISGLTVTFA